MAKIQKIELHSQQKYLNPFKTQRNSTTNPFKYQDFEGNTIDPLVCADVLVSFKSKQNKLKLISSSVMGSITKLHNSIKEPIVNFVRRVRSEISGVWDYAKNTNISDVKGFRTISKTLNTDITEIGKGISQSISGSISGMKEHITGKISAINTNVTELGKGISDKWNAVVEKLQVKKISKDTTVGELRAMWEEEIALGAKEVA